MASDQQRPTTPALSAHLVEQLTIALDTTSRGQIGKELQDALDAMCAEAHKRGLPPESMLLAVKAAWNHVPVPLGMRDHEWSQSYHAAVALCLSVYFDKKVEES